jgi:phage terminase large subunit
VQGIELQIKTPEWALPIVEADSIRYIGIWGGRGSGKSHFLAELLIERCILEKVDAVCVREVQKSLSKSVKKLLENKIIELGVGHLFEVQNDKIITPHGGMIIFTGMQNHTADSIKSLEGYDVAWIEEAQSLSQYSLDLLRPTIRKPGSQIWASWNPKFETDPIDKFLRCGNPPKGSIIVEVNFCDNPWLPDVLREEMEYDRSRDPDKYAWVWLGKYLKNSESRVFKNWRIEEFDAPASAIHRLGADWGFATDPSVLVRCHLEGRRLFIDYEAYQVGCEIMDTPDLFMTVPESEKWPMTADSARPETISHMRKNGFPKIAAAIKGPKSVEDGIEWLKSYEIIVHPRCTHVIDELTLYSYKIDKETDKILPILEDKNNHCIDAIRYACEGLRRAQATKPAQSFTPIPTATAWR